jgi:hypothetical protein
MSVNSGQSVWWGEDVVLAAQAIFDKLALMSD